jgi:hypothetical protein
MTADRPQDFRPATIQSYSPSAPFHPNRFTINLVCLHHLVTEIQSITAQSKLGSLDGFDSVDNDLFMLSIKHNIATLYLRRIDRHYHNRFALSNGWSHTSPDSPESQGKACLKHGGAAFDKHVLGIE